MSLVRAALSRLLNHHTIAPIPHVLLAETPGPAGHNVETVAIEPSKAKVCQPDRVAGNG
jgi:hypothetical protein